MVAIALLTLVFPADWFPASSADLFNFPTQEVAVQQLFLARQCLTARTEPKAREEAAERVQAWLWLTQVHEQTNDVSRSRYLTWLRRHLGDEAYYAGRMPALH